MGSPALSLLAFGAKGCIMSDEEYYEEEEVTSQTSKKGDGSFLKARQGAKKGELDEQLREYIDEWRKQRAKEEDELKRLREKQAKRKEIRAEQEKKLAQQKKEEEERLRKEEAEKKAKEAEKKRKRKKKRKRRNKCDTTNSQEELPNHLKNCSFYNQLPTFDCAPKNKCFVLILSSRFGIEKY